eukprot:TRINITY_DN12058_c0_g1_i1.p1 TRINITY_DN12058_c0_g1~~TRINITY_DN12058_c0_g1_i1.p1  ORF type:complete len:1179 (+),score=40.30 TRINITY_DN12058_c0_g1_i1:69-3605(+)
MRPRVQVPSHLVLVSAAAVQGQLSPGCSQLSPTGAEVHPPFQWPGCEGAKCIDGVTNGTDQACDPADNMCHSSEQSRSVWLRVDLPGTPAVCTVTLYNRQYCCQERLGYHEVWIGSNASFPDGTGNTMCASGTHKSKAEVTYDTGGCNGTHVYIYLPPDGGGGTRVLNLKEVLVTGPGPTASPTVHPSGVPSTEPTGRPTGGPSIGPSGSCWEFDTDMYGGDCANDSQTIDPADCNRLCAALPCCLWWACVVDPAHKWRGCWMKNRTLPRQTAQPNIVLGPKFCGATPTSAPTVPPTLSPTESPSVQPSVAPLSAPTPAPSVHPSAHPSGLPSANPSQGPTLPPQASDPTVAPSARPTGSPSASPSRPPTTATPTSSPSTHPTGLPSVVPSLHPTRLPTTVSPTMAPSDRPADLPSASPSRHPTAPPSAGPTSYPSGPPTTGSPSLDPSLHPTAYPREPTREPTATPSRRPSGTPTAAPMETTASPSDQPTTWPSAVPSRSPLTLPPTAAPEHTAPTSVPSASPSPTPPTHSPARMPPEPTVVPFGGPTLVPSVAPTRSPVGLRVAFPSRGPTRSPVSAPAKQSSDGFREALPDERAEAAAVALGFIGGGAASMGNLALADTVCHTTGTLRDLGRALHPTGLVVGGNMYFGCLAGAALIVCGATVLSYTALELLRQVDEDGDGILGRDELQKSFLKHIPVLRDSENIDLAALVRHPNTILVATLCIYQGASFAALRLLIAHQDETGKEVPAWERVVGGAFAACLAALPLWFYRSVHHGLMSLVRSDLPGGGPQRRARVRPWDDPKPPRWVQWVLLSPDGDWVSCVRSKHWINSWDVAVRPFKASCAAPAMAAEMGAMWLLSLVNAFATRSLQACGTVRLAAAMVHILHLLLNVRLRPYRCVRDYAARCVTQALLASALIMLAIGFYQADEGDAGWGSGNSARSGKLKAPAVVLLLQMVLRMIAEVVLLAKGWRANSQALEWAEGDAELALLISAAQPEAEQSDMGEASLLSFPSPPAAPASPWGRGRRASAAAALPAPSSSFNRGASACCTGASDSAGLGLSFINIVATSASSESLPTPRRGATQGGRAPGLRRSLRPGRGTALTPRHSACPAPRSPVCEQPAAEQWQGGGTPRRARAVTTRGAFSPQLGRGRTPLANLSLVAMAPGRSSFSSASAHH